MMKQMDQELQQTMITWKWSSDHYHSGGGGGGGGVEVQRHACNLEMVINITWEGDWGGGDECQGRPCPSHILFLEISRVP